MNSGKQGIHLPIKALGGQAKQLEGAFIDFDIPIYGVPIPQAHAPTLERKAQPLFPLNSLTLAVPVLALEFALPNDAPQNLLEGECRRGQQSGNTPVAQMGRALSVVSTQNEHRRHIFRQTLEYGQRVQQGRMVLEHQRV